MLEFKTKDFTEFFKDVLIAESEQDDVHVSRVLVASKSNNVITETEVWPTVPQRLSIAHNYENHSPTAKLLNSAYDGPQIKNTQLAVVPLHFTVTPYPPSACWRLCHSPNIAHTATFQNIHRGTGEVDVAFYLTNPTGEWEDTWIGVESPYAESPVEPVKFRFWYKDTGASGSGSGDVGGEEVDDDDPIPALLKWSFESNTPFIDSVRGVALAPYQNFTPDDYKIIEGGAAGKCLRGLYAATNKYITVADMNYMYMSSLNNLEAAHAKYAWYNAAMAATLYTAVESPTKAVDLAYTDDETQTFDITDVFTSNPNKWLAETGLDLTDDTKALTITFYTKQVKGSEVGFINTNKKSKLYYSGSYANGQWYTREGNTTGRFTPAMNGKGWAMLTATVYPPLDASDDANLYDAEKGYGFQHWFGLKINNLGFPYARDAASDTNSMYAWQYTPTGVRNPPETPPAHTLIYTTSDTPELNDPIYDAQGTQITATVNGNSVGLTVSRTNQRYMMQFTDTRFGREETPYTYVWKNNADNNDDPLKNNSKYVHLLICWTNAEFQAEGLYKSGPSLGGNSDFLVGIGVNNSSVDKDSVNYDAVDDIRVYDRALTQEEMEQLAAVITGAVPGGGGAGYVGNRELTWTMWNGLTPQKLHVGSGWYSYNPDLTVPNPTASNDRDAKFGWERISGTGPDNVWTTVYPYTAQNIGGMAFPATTGAASQELLITEFADLTATEFPWHYCDLQPYIIDNKTIAVVVCTHRLMIRMLRMRHPDVEALALDSTKGVWVGGQSYKYGEGIHGDLWDIHQIVQPALNMYADEATNWHVDGDSVTLYARHFTCPTQFLFHTFQWRNAQPGDKYYVDNSIRCTGDYVPSEIMQVAYLRLSEPMATGSTHTVTFLGSTCSIKYDPSQFCSTIKVDQEGYLPYPGVKRYAYLGRYMGSTEYTPDVNDRTFYLVPSSNPTVAGAIFTGTMTQRCQHCTEATNGMPASDLYGAGNYKTTKPMTGEDVFEMDFTNLTTCYKEKIVSQGVAYFRDTVEDYPWGYIELVNTTSDPTADLTFYRCPSKDTCSAWAWSTASRVQPVVVYTDTATPEAGDLCMQTPDGKKLASLEIQSVTEDEMLGWTTERTTEAAYGSATHVWIERSVYEGMLTTMEVIAEHPEYNFDPLAGVMAWESNEGLRAGGVHSVTSYEPSVETADISGEYQIYVPNIGWSHKFLLHPIVLMKQMFVHERGLFHQRSGCDKVRHPYTNWEYFGPAHEILFDAEAIPSGQQAGTADCVWAVDSESHEPDLDDYGSRKVIATYDKDDKMFPQHEANDKLNLPRAYGIYGGWFDAADFDMRQFHLMIPKYLANAYILRPENFTDGQLEIPESGDGIPDILSEALWGMELYRKAQAPNGGIRGWFETSSHEADWPWESTKRYYLPYPSRNHSLRYAAPAARLAKALRIAAERSTDPAAKERMNALATAYTESAISAFWYGVEDQSSPYMLKANREPVYVESQGSTWAWMEWVSQFNTDNVPSSGWKECGIFTMMSASALYALTKEQKYLPYLSTTFVQSYMDWAMNGQDSNALKNSENDSNESGNHVMVEMFDGELDDDIPTITAMFKAWYVRFANRWYNRAQVHPYRKAGFGPGHNNVNAQQWGTAHPEHRGMLSLAAWWITHDEKHRSFLLNSFNHINGCNTLGRTWTAHLGKLWPSRALDHWQPRNILRNDLWSLRMGHTPSIYGHNEQIPDKCFQRTIQGYWMGRAKSKAFRMQFWPGMLRSRYNFTQSNIKTELYYKRLPYDSVGQLYMIEPEHIACSEFTVDQTIGRKVAMLGVLMPPGMMPRPEWKQAKPLSYEENLIHFAFLP